MNTPEQEAAYIIAQAAVLFAKVSGMNAENLAREAQGNAPAYTEVDFENAINASGCTHNQVITHFQAGDHYR